MRRSKYGYLLLALLVITGLAGTVTSSSITSKERKLAASHLKESKADILSTIKGLSDDQLGLRVGPEKWSAKECIYHIASAEKNLWKILEETMGKPANPEKRAEIQLTDEQIIKLAEDRNKGYKATESFKCLKAPFKNVDEALESFKALRSDHIKYVKTTTEDLRNHVVRLPIGWIDCYQLCLFISAHSDRHSQQIEELQSDVNFPSR